MTYLKSINPRAVAVFLLIALIALAPLFFPSSYYFRVGTLIFINSVAVIGLVILVGFAGQISLGHAGFAGIGAYACALAPIYLGISPVLSLVLGAGVSGVLAWLLGRPILRLKGHYLAVATLGLGILISMLLTNEAQWTGGPDGINVEPLGLKVWLKSVGIQTKTSVMWYWLSSIILIIAVLLSVNLYHSPSGRALRSLHDSQIAAQTIGIDTAKFKLYAFVISAIFASVSGSLLALFNGFVTPDIAGFLHSIEWVTMAVLGGVSSVFGGIFGATVLTSLPQILAIFHDYEHLILGLTMMLVMIFMKDGALPGILAFLRIRTK